MSKKAQAKKNLVLIGKLFDYLASVKRISKGGYSYVIFSKKDKELNRENSKLLESLHKEGKKIIKAEETGDSDKPFRLSYI